ncbi:putative ribonuclease H-like domain-containing protein [Tanacetum coccineum]
MDEIVESENMDVTTIVTPSNVKKVKSNYESAGVKSNGDAVEPKTVRMNSFRPLVIEDWNFDDEIEMVETSKQTTLSSGKPKKLEQSYVLKTRKATHIRKSTRKKELLTVVAFKALGLENKCYFTKYKILSVGFVPLETGKGRNFRGKGIKIKDETSGILKTFITEIENQLDHKVKVIRCDNGTEFKNSVMNQFCEMKGIKREFSVARTPQQNGVAERRNRTLIEAARTMLVDSKLPTTFWAEAVNTACYVLNRVLVIKPHNKTPYELIRGRTPLIDFMKPFGCPVTILNTRDHLGKFDGKADEGFFVGYSVVSKAMRVFNKRTRIVEETLNIRFLENAPNVTGNGPDWLFDVDSLTISMNYVPVVAGNQTNGIAGTRDNIVAGQAEKKKEPEQEYILIPFCTTDPLISQDPKVSEEDAEEKPTEMDESGASDKDGKDEQATRSEFERLLQQEQQTENPNSTNSINTVSTPVSTAGPSCTDDDPSSPVNVAEASNAFEEHLFEQFSPFKNSFTLPLVSNATPMDDTGIFSNAYDDEDVGAKADLNNLETTMNVSHIPTTKIDKDHPKDQIIEDFNSEYDLIYKKNAKERR